MITIQHFGNKIAIETVMKAVDSVSRVASARKVVAIDFFEVKEIILIDYLD